MDPTEKPSGLMATPNQNDNKENDSHQLNQSKLENPSPLDLFANGLPGHIKPRSGRAEFNSSDVEKSHKISQV